MTISALRRRGGRVFDDGAGRARELLHGPQWSASREATITIVFGALTFLTVVGHDPTSSLTIPYGKYLFPVVLFVDAVLLIAWKPASAVLFGVGVSLLQFQHGNSLIFGGAFIVLILATVRAWAQAPPSARRGSLLFVVLAVATLIPGTALTGLHDTGGEPVAIVYAAAIGACAAVVRPPMPVLLGTTIAVGSLASYLAITSPQLRLNRTFAILGQNANGLGMLAALGAVASLVAIKRRSIWLRLAAVGTGWLCVEGILSSGSRGALLAAIAGAAALLGHRLIAGSGVRMTITVAALGAGVYFLAAPAFVLVLKAAGRGQVGSANNIQERASALSFALKQGLSHPIFGVGLNRLPTVSHQDPNSGLGLSAHNVFAGVFAECGITALLALLAVAALTLVRSRRHSSDGVLALVVTVLVNGLSLAWWGAGLPGVMSALILGSALGLTPPFASEPVSEVAVDTPAPLLRPAIREPVGRPS